jgi:Double zinc ribbon/Phospholipase_D-nuclease N-terminal
MTIQNQTSLRPKDELRILAPWAYTLFAAVFVIISVAFVICVGMDRHAPSFPIRCLLGTLAGGVLGCYAVLIGYVNQDAGRRNMSRLLWTLIAMFVPNGLGIVLYFVLRKPRIAHCPQCDAQIEPGFSFCPRCSCKLNPSCPRCQRVVGISDVYCPFCGTSLHTQETSQVSPSI